MSADDGWGRQEILQHSIAILEEYAGTALTVRRLHYRLVDVGMPNDQHHYKRVVACMTEARWTGEVGMEAFVDRERGMVGETAADDMDLEGAIEEAETQVENWMTFYEVGMWANQPKYVEVWIEKKADQDMFEDVCKEFRVGLAPCKGYPSLTFLNEAKERFPGDKDVVLLYFGDYDPSGEDIPRSLQENIECMGGSVEVERIALNPDQIAEWKLHGKPVKLTDSRTRTWDGDTVVELDAADPKVIPRLCREAILKHVDVKAFNTYKERVERETPLYRQRLLDFVKEMAGASQ